MSERIESVFPVGNKNEAFAKYFVGQSYLNMLSTEQVVPKYVVLATVLVLVSAALPAYSQTVLAKIGIPVEVVPTLANLVNILVQVALSYPVMKFWIMPKKRTQTLPQR